MWTDLMIGTVVWGWLAVSTLAVFLPGISGAALAAGLLGCWCWWDPASVPASAVVLASWLGWGSALAQAGVVVLSAATRRLGVLSLLAAVGCAAVFPPLGLVAGAVAGLIGAALLRGPWAWFGAPGLAANALTLAVIVDGLGLLAVAGVIALAL